MSRGKERRPGSASTFSPSTIAAPCAGRAVSGVVAIRAYLRGEDPERKSSREFHRSFEAGAGVFSHRPALRSRGLRNRGHNFLLRYARRLWCTHVRSHGWLQHAGVYLSHALSLAVFPYPGRSLCWITIRHMLIRCVYRGCVYRAPCTPQRCGPRKQILRQVCGRWDSGEASLRRVELELR